MRRVRERGFTYIEMVAALAIVGLALVISGGVLVRWRTLSTAIGERARAEQALATEVDHLLASGPSDLREGVSPWATGADRESGLAEARGTVEVSRFQGTELRRLQVKLRWGNGKTLVRETLIGGRL